MSTEIEFETTVRGGLPVIVTCRLYPAEPDVGISTESVEIDNICWPSGKTITDRVWRSIPQADFDRIAEEARNGAVDRAADYADYLYQQRRDRLMEQEMQESEA